MLRTNTFTNIGNEVIGATSVDAALKLGNLDYEVEKQPIYLSDGTLINDRMATVRDDGYIYDIVSDQYKIIQNRDAFSFIDEMKDDIKFEKVGETQSGMIYLIASLETLRILGDNYQPYLIFRNSHNGRYQLQATICPLRIVCQNQFNIAFRESPNTITIRHSSLAEIRMKEATRVLKGTADYLNSLNSQAEKWANTRVDNIQIKQIINELFPLDTSMKDFQFQRIEEQRSLFLNAYNSNDNSNFRNTMWGMINAYSDFITHKNPLRNTETAEESKFIAVTFDPKIMSNFIKIVNSRIAA